MLRADTTKPIQARSHAILKPKQIMKHEPPKTKKILLLYSKTGGGHYAVAQAIAEEIERRNLDVKLDIRDPWVDEAPAPLNKLPAWYPYVVRSKALWQTIYEFTDRKLSAKLLKETYSKYARPMLKRIFSTHYDLVISTHFGYNAPILNYLSKTKEPPKYITVVTDYITGHRLWFDHRATVCIVPSKELQRRGLENGMEPSQLPICGLPLKREFETSLSKSQAETQTNLAPTKKLRVLLMGGGEGMGQLSTIAKACNKSALDIELVVVAGNNKALKQRLEQYNWKINVKIFGFTNQIAALMKASDLVLTKGGPTSILEAATLGIPMVVYDYLPGQEEGNVLALLTSGAGQLVTDTEQLVSLLERYSEHPQLLKNFKAGCQSLSQKGATKRTVDRILEEL
jgi:1,2-diacylglycerol 3-beta-galactosyltransferase